MNPNTGEIREYESLDEWRRKGKPAGFTVRIPKRDRARVEAMTPEERIAWAALKQHRLAGATKAEKNAQKRERRARRGK